MTQLLRRRRGAEDGMSLVEMMVAILVLGVAMAGLAQALISSLRATREAETTEIVTAATMEMIEELQAKDWNEATLYEVDVAAADSRWSDRLDSGGTFEGLELVTLAGPATAAERNDEIPMPSWTETRNGTSYTFDLYPVWVNRSATDDGVADTKRFVVIATWDDPIRGEQTLRTAAERAPTQGEAISNASGGRFLLKYASPDPVDAEATVGTLDQHVDFVARTNVGLTGAVTATMEWIEPIEDADGNVTYQNASETISLGPVEAGSDGGWITFEGDFNGHRGNVSTNGKYRFVNGDVTVDLAGTTLDGDAVTSTLSFTVRNGPYESPDGPVDDPTEEPTEDPTDDGSGEDPTYSADPGVGGVSVSAICSSSSDWKLTDGIDITVTVTDVAPPSGTVGTSTYVAPDATVTVSFPHWSQKWGKLHDPDTVGSVSASWQAGTQSSSTWIASIPVNPETLFRPGNAIDFTVDVTRSSDGANGTGTSSPRTITSC